MKTPAMLRFENKAGRSLEDILVEAVNRHNGNLQMAAKEVGLNPHTYYVWLLRLGFSKQIIWTKERK